MALTTIDLDAAFALGQAQAQEWEQEFQLNWNGPLIEAQAVQMYLSLPPGDRAMLKQADPELAARLEMRVKELQRKLGAQG